MTDKLVEQVKSTPEGLRLFEQEGLILEVTEQICAAMEHDGVTRAELAARLGKSKAYVTQLLGGGTNMTLRTIADVFTALGRSLRVSAVPLNTVGEEQPAGQPQAPRSPLRISSFSVERQTGSGSTQHSPSLNLSA